MLAASYQKHATCMCTRTWREIRSAKVPTGGLGSLMVEDVYEVWVCMPDDMCSHEYNAFCYVYNEKTLHFEPWGYNSELNLF